ncbi:hypothetical protein EV1_018706 [Malus domestica]
MSGAGTTTSFLVWCGDGVFNSSGSDSNWWGGTRKPHHPVLPCPEQLCLLPSLSTLRTMAALTASTPSLPMLASWSMIASRSSNKKQILNFKDPHHGFQFH